MRTTACGAALLFLLVSSSLAGLQTERAAKDRKVDDLAKKLERMRDQYQELLTDCWGRGYYLYETEGEVWKLSEAPDPRACKKAEALKDDYRAGFKDLLKLDRRLVLFENIPKYVDRR